MPITKRTNKREPEYIGAPDGPQVLIPEFGCEVGTFLRRCEDMEYHIYRNVPCLMYHIPIQFRGPYAPQALPTYDPKIDYPVNQDGLVICSAPRIMRPGQQGYDGSHTSCRKLAVNRSGKCPNHGGKLHPLDKQKQEIRDPSTMDRWELLHYGYLDVDDLDDEELIKGMARRSDGSMQVGVQNKMIPRPMYDKLVSRMFERVNEQIREASMDAVRTMVEIMNGDAFEAVDRKDAAKWLLERFMGKNPQTVDLNIGMQKPYEQILSGINPLTREESRAQRGLPQAGIIEGEIVNVSSPETDFLSSGNGQVRNGNGQQFPDHDSRADANTGPVGEPWSTTQTPLADHLSTSEFNMIHSIMAPPDVQHVEAQTETTNSQSVATDSISSDEPLTKEELKAKIQKARNRRYAAREQGNTSIRDLGYQRKVIPYDYVPKFDADGNETQYRRPTKFLVQWIHPDDVAVPPTVKAKETKRRNQFRRRTPGGST